MFRGYYLTTKEQWDSNPGRATVTLRRRFCPNLEERGSYPTECLRPEVDCRACGDRRVLVLVSLPGRGALRGLLVGPAVAAAWLVRTVLVRS